MTDCDLIRIGTDAEGYRLYRCDRCGEPKRSLLDANKLHRPCHATAATDELPQPPPRKPALPPLWKRLENFTHAAIAHALNGFPTCTQADIDARLQICRGCPLYLPSPENPELGVCTHVKCGCNLASGEGFLNKLAWRDQQCPKTPPLWPRLG